MAFSCDKDDLRYEKITYENLYVLRVSHEHVFHSHATLYACKTVFDW